MLQLTQITVSRAHQNGEAHTHAQVQSNIVQLGQRTCLGAVHKAVEEARLRKMIAFVKMEREHVNIHKQINVKVRLI